MGISTLAGLSRVILKFRLNVVVRGYSIFTEFCMGHIFSKSILLLGFWIFQPILSLALMLLYDPLNYVFNRSLMTFMPLWFIACGWLIWGVCSFGDWFYFDVFNLWNIQFVEDFLCISLLILCWTPLNWYLLPHSSPAVSNGMYFISFHFIDDYRWHFDVIEFIGVQIHACLRV